VENDLLQRYGHPFFIRDQADALTDYFGLEDNDLLETFLSDKASTEETDYMLWVIGNKHETN
jgi:hypothetical protein